MSIDASALRKMLHDAPPMVCVALPSGECWGLLRAVRRRDADVTVAGITIAVPLAAIRSVMRGVEGAGRARR